ncbi:MAG: hypothetical protein B6U86_02555 [Candidatus Altiarchaeales archaeon ex4484_43]|nr:MAG: hypothetical protein B6U86_02555 [Candidatus Altiarchaeales archaeon ex4484_43]
MTGDKIDTDNIYVNEEGMFVSIRVNPKLYKKHVIMRAADDLLHKEKNIDVIVNGDPEVEIIVKFIPKEGRKSKEELLRIAYSFNSLLVTTFGKG